MGETVKEARKNRVKQAYGDFLTNIDTPPLLVLYGSDGRKAEKIAERLPNRRKLRTREVASRSSRPLQLTQPLYPCCPPRDCKRPLVVMKIRPRSKLG